MKRLALPVVTSNAKTHLLLLGVAIMAPMTRVFAAAYTAIAPERTHTAWLAVRTAPRSAMAFHPTAPRSDGPSAEA